MGVGGSGRRCGSFLPGRRKHVHDTVGRRWWQKCTGHRIGGRWEKILVVFVVVVVRDGFHDDHGVVVGDGTI